LERDPGVARGATARVVNSEGRGFVLRGVAGGKLRSGAIEVVWRGPLWTHQRSRDFRFWVWPRHSAARIAFPASFGGRCAVENCRFHPFWEVAATAPSGKSPVPPLLGNRRDHPFWEIAGSTPSGKSPVPPLLGNRRDHPKGDVVLPGAATNTFGVFYCAWSQLPSCYPRTGPWVRAPASPPSPS